MARSRAELNDWDSTEEEKIHFQVRQRSGQMGQASKTERPDLIQRRVIQPTPMLKNSFLLVKKNNQNDLGGGKLCPHLTSIVNLTLHFCSHKKNTR